MATDTVPYGRKTQRDSPVSRSPHRLDHRRPRLRRRFGVDHRSNATQHRGCAARRDPGTAESPSLQPGPRVRERRGIHQVMARRCEWSTRPVRARRGGVDSQRDDQERGLLGSGWYRRRNRTTDHDVRVDRPPRAQGARGRRVWDVRNLRRHSCDAGESDGSHGPRRLPRMGLEVEGGSADRQCPGMPGTTRQLHGDGALPAVHGGGARSDHPAGRSAAARPGSSATPCTMAAIARLRTSKATSQPTTTRRGASSSLAAGVRSSTATSRSADGWPASAVAPTSAGSASVARCLGSRTSSCRSWMNRRARTFRQA